MQPRIRSRSRSSDQACAIRWWPKEMGCACWRWVKTGTTTSAFCSARSARPIARVPDLLGAGNSGTPKVETYVERHLIVARPPGVELPADLADEFDETSLHRTVDILVTVPELELVRLRLGEDAPQPVGEG